MEACWFPTHSTYTPVCTRAAQSQKSIHWTLRTPTPFGFQNSPPSSISPRDSKGWAAPHCQVDPHISYYLESPGSNNTTQGSLSKHGGSRKLLLASSLDTLVSSRLSERHYLKVIRQSAREGHGLLWPLQVHAPHPQHTCTSQTTHTWSHKPPTLPTHPHPSTTPTPHTPPASPLTNTNISFSALVSLPLTFLLVLLQSQPYYFPRHLAL